MPFLRSSSWRLLSLAFSLGIGAASNAPIAGPLPAANEASGSLFVTSLPSGADLWVDGVHMGQTPMLVGALYRGRHSLTLAKSGWATQAAAFRVVPDSVAMQNRYLVRLGSAGPGRDGAAIFHLSPGAKILVDGIAPVLTAGPLMLRAGTHDAVVEQNGVRYRREFTIFPEMTTEILLRDAPTARMPSVVAPVDSEIPAASISVQRTKIIIRYHGHLAVGHLGDPNIRVDAQNIRIEPAPVLLDGKLYLPVDIITLLTGTS
jgi:hypothetical protein